MIIGSSGTVLKQVKISDCVVNKWPNDNKKSQKIDDKILRYICLSLDALSVTERNGFGDILEEACPK